MSVDYKYKPDKHKFRVNIKTIDELHKEHVDEFKKNRESMPEKKQKLKNYQQDLKLLEKETEGKPINLNIDLIKKRNNLKRLIKDLEEEIEKIENCSNEMDYFSRTGEVIYDYYDITNGLLYGQNFDTDDKNSKSKINLDNDNIINKEVNQSSSKIEISDELLSITNLNRKRKLKRPVKKRSKRIEITETKSIMSYLLGSDEEKEEEKEQENTVCKATLQNEYLLMIDKEYACSKTKASLVKKCKKCNIDMVIIYNEAIISCPKCAESEEIFIESDVPSHRETFTEKPKYPYKKIGHCIEKLNQFLCKSNANIPSDVFTSLEGEIDKHGLDKSEITISFLEKMLKKHRLSDYYENIMYIYSKITGKNPQTISRDEYERVLKMFVQAEDIYEKKYKPSNRNNFLKYTFVLNKIFLTIQRPDIAIHFKLLKSGVKMKEQEKIWKLICCDLGWKYYSS
jgi:hypothetical protein